MVNFLFRRFGLKYNSLNNIYKGICKEKTKVLKKYKFTFCVENVIDVPGYNTIQIFDALRASSVPIYLGRSDLNKIIPKNCYINYKSFSDLKSLFNYINNMSRKNYYEYLKNINYFCKKKFPEEFKEENYSKTIIKQLIKDAKRIS